MRGSAIEWPTLGILVLCWVSWCAIVVGSGHLGAFATILLLSPSLALYSSLQHEALHGHPTRHAGLNAALVTVPFGLFIPYPRFRDLHLAHHRNQHLTDPFEDPESYYVDPDQWARFPGLWKAVLTANNTLVGRMVIGPALGTVGYWRADFDRIRAGEPGILRAWLFHALHVSTLIAALSFLFSQPWWVYLVAAYGGMAIIHVRTFVEHRAHEDDAARTVAIEDRGPLAFLFLNNNLHAAHHLRPGLAWYALPAFYARHRTRLLHRNGGYWFRSYAEVFRRHAFRPKEPVAHPLMERDPVIGQGQP